MQCSPGLTAKLTPMRNRDPRVLNKFLETSYSRRGKGEMNEGKRKGGAEGRMTNTEHGTVKPLQSPGWIDTNVQL